MLSADERRSLLGGGSDGRSRRLHRLGRLLGRRRLGRAAGACRQGRQHQAQHHEQR